MLFAEELLDDTLDGLLDELGTADEGIDELLGARLERELELCTPPK